MVRSANFIKANSRLTVRVPLDVIIKRDECSQAVCNQAIFACIWTLCHIYRKDERLGIEGTVGSINLTQHLRTGTLIIPSMENHPHQTRAPVCTRCVDHWMQEGTEGELVGDWAQVQPPMLLHWWRRLRTVVWRCSLFTDVFTWLPLPGPKGMQSSVTLKAQPSGYTSFYREVIMPPLICPFVEIVFFFFYQNLINI